jgi:hypothetical protein
MLHASDERASRVHSTTSFICRIISPSRGPVQSEAPCYTELAHTAAQSTDGVRFKIELVRDVIDVHNEVPNSFRLTAESVIIMHPLWRIDARRLVPERLLCARVCVHNGQHRTSTYMAS